MRHKMMSETSQEVTVPVNVCAMLTQGKGITQVQVLCSWVMLQTFFRKFIINSAIFSEAHGVQIHHKYYISSLVLRLKKDSFFSLAVFRKFLCGLLVVVT